MLLLGVPTIGNVVSYILMIAVAFRMREVTNNKFCQMTAPHNIKSSSVTNFYLSPPTMVFTVTSAITHTEVYLSDTILL